MENKNDLMIQLRDASIMYEQLEEGALEIDISITGTKCSGSCTPYFGHPLYNVLREYLIARICGLAREVTKDL